MHLKPEAKARRHKPQVVILVVYTYPQLMHIHNCFKLYLGRYSTVSYLISPQNNNMLVGTGGEDAPIYRFQLKRVLKQESTWHLNRNWRYCKNT